MNNNLFCHNFINIKFDIKILLIILNAIYFYIISNTPLNIDLAKINSDGNKIIEENFFIIDSNNLDKIKSHMYGFCVSKKGILTDNYYNKINYNEEPDPQGTYVFIRKIGNELRINQDFQGDFGLYIYKNKISQYFALSNSFLLLEEYLSEKENITFNRNFADELILATYCAASLHETLINEITKLRSNALITINIKDKNFKLDYVDYLENTVPLESAEGLKIIDNWVDKWGYIYRSLKKKTDNMSSDLSGGFDTRVLTSILISSGLDLNKTLINSLQDNFRDHHIDLKIAKNISSQLGFELNKFQLDDNNTLFNIKDAVICSLYSKLGFSKSSGFNNRFFSKPRFYFTGCGGEVIRGYPGYPIGQYIDSINSRGKRINWNMYELSNSINIILQGSLKLLTKNKKYKNDYEITADLYAKGCMRNHCSKISVYNFLFNIYTFCPLLDPDIKKIKYDMNEKSQDLVAYIYIRFARTLINFPFQGNRTLDISSVQKAENLNKKLPKYKIKSHYNKNFYIDLERKSPVVYKEKNQINVNECLKQLYNSPKFINSFNKIYNADFYYSANDYLKKLNISNNGYSFFAISKILNDLYKI
jgi:hypothetical protein